MVAAAPATTASAPAQNPPTNHHAGRLPPIVCADDANDAQRELVPDIAARAKRAATSVAAPIATTIRPPMRRNGPRAASSATDIASSASPIADERGRDVMTGDADVLSSAAGGATVAAPQVRPDANSSNDPGERRHRAP